MSAQRDMVMTHDNVVRKLDRMARELLEVHFQESSLVLIGVAGQGVALCEALSSRLQALSNLEVVTGTLTATAATRSRAVRAQPAQRATPNRRAAAAV